MLDTKGVAKRAIQNFTKKGGEIIKKQYVAMGGTLPKKSIPMSVDVSANGMAKKYSRGSIRTSYGSSGLLTGSRLNKKTLLGE
jgi:hypothetical protein